MKRRFAFLLCFSLPILSYSQEMVKVNIVTLYDKIPAPPVDAKVAHARLVCVVENAAQRCDAVKFYQPINSELAALQQRLEKTQAALAQPSVNAMQKIDPQEMQKKLEKMTPEEKIKFAMQMSQQMAGAQNIQPESEEVQAAIEEVNTVNSRANEDYINPDETAKKMTQMQSDWRRKQDEVRKWQSAEYEKVPQISGGPGVGIIVEYGEAAVNTTFKQMFVQGQTVMLTTAANLIHLSREASESAGRVWQEKLQLEKQKL